MTDIAYGYYVNRIFGLTIILICLSISSLQIYLLRMNSKQFLEVKYFIHYCVFFTLCTLFLCFIDNYGVFGIMPYFFTWMVMDVIGTKVISSSAIFIVYGHFVAHYRVLKKDIPSFFKTFFILNVMITFIISVITQTLLYATSNRIWQTIGGIGGLIFLYGTWGPDIYGYYLVRKFILELKFSVLTPLPPPTPTDRTEKEEPSPSSLKTSGPPLSQNQFDYDEFLIRMRRFHIGVTVLTILFTVLTVVNMVSGIRKRLDPDHFSFFDGLIFYPYLYLLVSCFLLWWVWIPIKFNKDDCTLQIDSHHGSSQKTTQHPTTSGQKTSKEKEDHHNEEEMGMLHSTNQNSPQENSKHGFDYPNLRDVSRSQDEGSIHGRETSVSVSELESPTKENNRGFGVTMAGITEEGGLVSYDEG